MFLKLTVLFLFTFSFSLNADVVKWVDNQGKTHYSNKAPKKHKKSSKKITFVKYKKPEKLEVVLVPAVDWSKDFTQINTTFQTETDNNQKPKKSRQRKQKVKEPTITELRAQCDIAREKRLAPARAEAIEACIEKNQRQTKNVAAYCERFNRTFGEEQYGSFYSNLHGRYRVTRSQRLFHNIPECRRLYRAEDKRSRLIRGYRE